MMWLKCAVVSAATIAGLSAQSWEVSPFAGYLRLSKKPLGSLDTSAPKDDDTKLAARQPGYGFSVTLNTPGYYGVGGSTPKLTPPAVGTRCWRRTQSRRTRFS